MTFDGEPQVWIINPEFVDENSSAYDLGQPVPGTVRANMYILSAQARPLLRSIVYVGRKVSMVEGMHPVATGEITAIKNLPNALS